jgi:hypothetical protein
LIFAPPNMQWLVDVADEMHQKLQRDNFVLRGGLWILEHCHKPLDGFDDITRGIFGRRLVGLVIGNIDIMPGSSMVPRRISAHFVRPGADLGKALRAEQGLDVLPGLGGQMLFSNTPDDAVPDRACTDTAIEENTFLSAVAAVRTDLRASGARLASVVPVEAHAMFRVYAELLGDEHLFAGAIKRRYPVAQVFVGQEFLVAE